MELIQGGAPDPPRPGTVVRISMEDGKHLPATVIQANFKTRVFRGHVSVRYQDGTLDLIEQERVILRETGDPGIE